MTIDEVDKDTKAQDKDVPKARSYRHGGRILTGNCWSIKCPCCASCSHQGRSFVVLRVLGELRVNLDIAVGSPHAAIYRSRDILEVGATKKRNRDLSSVQGSNNMYQIIGFVVLWPISSLG